MITGKSFEEYVNNLSGNFLVEYVSNDNPHWDLYITDPAECDEETLFGTLDANTLELKVPGIKYEEDSCEWLFGGGGFEKYRERDKDKTYDEEFDDDEVKWVYIALTEKDLLQEIFELISFALSEHLSYYDSICDFLNEDIEQLEDESDE